MEVSARRTGAPEQEEATANNATTPKPAGNKRRNNSILYTFGLLILLSLAYVIVDHSEVMEVQTTSYYTTKLTTHVLPRNHSNQQQQQRDHCVIHIHGFHHSGTGFLRKTVYDSLGGDGYASIHIHTRKAQDEGQHIQDVYPKFYMRRQHCTYDPQRSFGNLYYCPEMMSIPTKQRNKERLFHQWARYWNMTKPFLIQKTPTFDILFLEKMKTLTTLHTIVMRHPFAWKPTLASAELKANPGLFTLCTWVDVWAYVLEILANNQVESFAIVKYEALVEDHDEISHQLSTLIQDECGISVENNQTTKGRIRRRRLHLRFGNSSEYLVPSKLTLRRWKKCEENQVCHELMDKLTPIIAEFDYSWDRDAYYFNNTVDAQLLYSSNHLPPKELFEEMRQVGEKYCTS